MGCIAIPVKQGAHFIRNIYQTAKDFNTNTNTNTNLNPTQHKPKLQPQPNPA